MKKVLLTILLGLIMAGYMFFSKCPPKVTGNSIDFGESLRKYQEQQRDVQPEEPKELRKSQDSEKPRTIKI